MNERPRFRDNLSAKEIITRRDQISLEPLLFEDNRLSDLQLTARKKRHPEPAVEEASFYIGQNVYLRNDVTKTRAREMYRIVKVENETISIQKTEGKIKQRIYNVKPQQLIPTATNKSPQPEKEAQEKSSEAPEVTATGRTSRAAKSKALTKIKNIDKDPDWIRFFSATDPPHIRSVKASTPKVDLKERFEEIARAVELPSLEVKSFSLQHEKVEKVKTKPRPKPPQKTIQWELVLEDTYQDYSEDDSDGEDLSDSDLGTDDEEPQVDPQQDQPPQGAEDEDDGPTSQDEVDRDHLEQQDDILHIELQNANNQQEDDILDDEAIVQLGELHMGPNLNFAAAPEPLRRPRPTFRPSPAVSPCHGFAPDEAATARQRSVKKKDLKQLAALEEPNFRGKRHQDTEYGRFNRTNRLDQINMGKTQTLGGLFEQVEDDARRNPAEPRITRQSKRLPYTKDL